MKSEDESLSQLMDLDPPVVIEEESSEDDNDSQPMEVEPDVATEAVIRGMEGIRAAAEATAGQPLPHRVAGEDFFYC